MSAAQSQIFGRDSKGRNQPYAISDPVAGTQVLTFSGQPANGEPFTIGGQVYTFVTALTIGTPNQVKIGVDTATSIANATAAVMKGDGQDTAYTAATLKNANVTAVAASTTLTVTAITPGADGNNITTTESIANASWGAATLTGGAYGVLVVGSLNGSGIPVTPPTVNGVKIVGIQEVDTWAAKSGSYTAVAGALSILFNPSSDFVGTVNGATWSGSAGTAANQGAVSRTAQPGNTLPAFVVTLSAGTFLMAEARPV